jgi:oxygen-independent coproporphyrinogen-3 oxidase
MQSERKVSIYVHFPFCKSRCSYCDFNTYAGCEDLIPEYIQALLKEIQVTNELLGNIDPVHTLYFGGGTPSIIPESFLECVIEGIYSNFCIDPDSENTIELNPTPLNQKYLSALRDMGFNRVSIGMQSAHSSELVVLGRRHRHKDLETAFEFARAAGFSNINLDLIYGFPTQTLESFAGSLRSALKLEPEHMSLYGLGLHEGTKLYEQIQRGVLPAPDDDLAADMYQYASDVLRNEGFQQYEISNWARDERYYSRHNMQYWYNGNYIGFGAGAHSHYKSNRWENVKTIKEYICRAKAASNYPPFASGKHELTEMDEIQETMIMGLRLTQEGINLQSFKERFGKSIYAVYKKEINELISKGLIEISGKDEEKKLRLTAKARILGNQVFEKFVILRD